MAIYAFWNNLGGVGKSYLTFQVACEYARTHPNRNVLVVDLCTQAKSSVMLLGGIFDGEAALDSLYQNQTRPTIAGYIAERLRSPYDNPQLGSRYMVHLKAYNPNVPPNMFLVPGDSRLEVQAALVRKTSLEGPPDAWRLVHGWISDLIEDIRQAWKQPDMAVFIDCSTSFSIWTELGLAASERLMVPISADAASRRAVRTVLALLHNIGPEATEVPSEFFLQAQRFKLAVPKVYGLVANHISKFHGSGQGFGPLIELVLDDLFQASGQHPNAFWLRPESSVSSRKSFEKVFRYELNDANYATISSSLLGIPLMNVGIGRRELVKGKSVLVKQWHLDREQPNLRKFLARVE